MDLSTEFTQELIEKCRISKEECGYYPSRFIQTIAQRGGVETARFLIAKAGISDGFEKLQSLGRLELSMEATVVEPRFAPLFTDDEVNYCFDLLCQCGYFKP